MCLIYGSNDILPFFFVFHFLAQSFLNYVLLCLVFTVTLACRYGDQNQCRLATLLKRDWWKYLILAGVDVEANYLVVKAYTYTTITSVQVQIYGIQLFYILTYLLMRSLVM